MGTILNFGDLAKNASFKSYGIICLLRMPPTTPALPEDRYPKQLFNQEWNVKPCRVRQRKVWSRMVDDLFKSLDIDTGEWLEDIKHGGSSSHLHL